MTNRGSWPRWGTVLAILVVAAGLLAPSAVGAEGDEAGAADCYENPNPPPDLICTGSTGGGGETGGVAAPPDAVWYVYFNPTANCYATGWEYSGSVPGYPGWLVLTRPTFGFVMTVLTWLDTGTFTWEDFDEDGSGSWDAGEAANAANALFGSFDLEACAAPPNDIPWVLSFIEGLSFTAGTVETAPPGNPVAGWPAYVTLEPDLDPLEASGGVVVTDPDGSRSVRWELTNPASGNVITVTADPMYRVYWDVEGQPDLHTESTRGDVTWPAEGQGELAHRYQTKGPRDILGQVRWQVEWETPVASGTEEFVRETPHQWTVEEYQGVVDG